MAGEARTQAFSIGTATVMLGPLPDLWKLNPEDHSIGLVKDFAVTAEPTYTELRQGVKNTLVYSILTQNDVRASCSVYEYTAKNLRYSLGVSPEAFVAYEGITDAAAASGATAVSLVAVDPSETAAADIVSDARAVGISAGNYIFVHDKGGNRDKVHLGKIMAVAGTPATGTPPTGATIDVTFTADTAFGDAFPAGSVAGSIDKFEAGVKTEQDFYSMKVAGILPEDSKPIVLLVPKVRVIRGFNVNFSTDDFQSMPFEFGMFEPVTGDTSVGDLPNGGVMSVFTGT